MFCDAQRLSNFLWVSSPRGSGGTCIPWADAHQCPWSFLFCSVPARSPFRPANCWQLHPFQQDGRGPRGEGDAE